MKENKNIEFKSNFNDSVIETLCAFANTKGGKVIVGLDNHGLPVKNFRVGNETIQQWINEIKTKTQPSIIADADLKKVNGKDVVEIAIQEFPVKPVSFKSRFYKRVNNSNHVLNATEISNLYMQSLQVSWDSYPFQNADYKQLSIPKIKSFIKKVNDGGRFLLPDNPREALQKLNLIHENTVSNAAMILFASKNLHYNVHVGRFKTASLIIDDKLISGNLYDVVKETMQFILSHLKVAFEIKGKNTQRTEIFEYPIPAIRELVLNAIIHRDYSSPSDVQIKIFDQKITFFNPGKLFGNIELKDLKGDRYASQTRNKLIAEAFYLTKDIEKYGSGFIRVRKEIEEYLTMKFLYTEQGNGFLSQLNYTEQTKTLFDKTENISNQKTRNKIGDKKDIKIINTSINSLKSLVLKQNEKAINLKVGDKVGDKVGEKVGEKVGDKVTDRVTDKVTDKVTDRVTDNLSENQLEIIRLMKKNRFITTIEIAYKLEISQRKIKENIGKLKEKGYVKRIGSAKGGHWEIVTKFN